MRRDPDGAGRPVFEMHAPQSGPGPSSRGGVAIRPSLVEKAEALSNERKARRRATGRHGRFLQGPAWTILLALFVLRSKNLAPAVTTVSYDVEIPVSTCLRWLRELDEADLVSSYVDETDTRVRRVKLTDEAVALVVGHLG